jgi:hypothetical protein
VRALAAKHPPTLAVMASLAQLQTPHCSGPAVRRTGFRPFVPAAAVTHRTATATGPAPQQQPAGVSHAPKSRSQQLACRASAEQVTAAACLPPPPAAAAAALAAACSTSFLCAQCMLSNCLPHATAQHDTIHSRKPATYTV